MATRSPAIARRAVSNGRTFLAVSYFVAILYATLIVLPLYFLVVSAFKDNTGIYLNPLSLPSHWSFEKFALAQERVQLIQAMGLSLFVTATALGLNLVLGFMAAYAIARIPGRMARVTEVIFSVGFLIPSFAVLVPVFIQVVRLGLLRNPLALICFYSASTLPLTVVILATTLRAIPRELEESATLDGASRWHMVWHIFFPLSSSGLATVAILNVLTYWNEYLFALVLLGGNTRTAQVALPLLRGEKSTDYALITAGVLLTMLPVYLLFVFFQERIIQGQLGGAVKG